jgi:hypothetical protein
MSVASEVSGSGNWAVEQSSTMLHLSIAQVFKPTAWVGLWQASDAVQPHIKNDAVTYITYENNLHLHWMLCSYAHMEVVMFCTLAIKQASIAENTHLVIQTLATCLALTSWTSQMLEVIPCITQKQTVAHTYSSPEYHPMSYNSNVTVTKSSALS